MQPDHPKQNAYVDPASSAGSYMNAPPYGGFHSTAPPMYAAPPPPAPQPMMMQLVPQQQPMMTLMPQPHHMMMQAASQGMYPVSFAPTMSTAPGGGGGFMYVPVAYAVVPQQFAMTIQPPPPPPPPPAPPPEYATSIGLVARQGGRGRGGLGAQQQRSGQHPTTSTTTAGGGGGKRGGGPQSPNHLMGGGPQEGQQQHLLRVDSGAALKHHHSNHTTVPPSNTTSATRAVVTPTPTSAKVSGNDAPTSSPEPTEIPLDQLPANTFQCVACRGMWDGSLPSVNDRRPHYFRIAGHFDRRLGKILKGRNSQSVATTPGSSSGGMITITAPGRGSVTDSIPSVSSTITPMHSGALFGEVSGAVSSAGFDVAEFSRGLFADHLQPSIEVERSVDMHDDGGVDLSEQFSTASDNHLSLVVKSSHDYALSSEYTSEASGGTFLEASPSGGTTVASYAATPVPLMATPSGVSGGSIPRRAVLLRHGIIPVTSLINDCVWTAMQDAHFCSKCVIREVTLQPKAVIVHLKNCINFPEDLIGVSVQGKNVVLPHILLPAAAANRLALELNESWRREKSSNIPSMLWSGASDHLNDDGDYAIVI